MKPQKEDGVVKSPVAGGGFHDAFKLDWESHSVVIKDLPSKEAKCSIRKRVRFPVCAVGVQCHRYIAIQIDMSQQHVQLCAELVIAYTCTCCQGTIVGEVLQWNLQQCA